ncbi:50S ribosomal protein L6 [Candidatus Woesearchaeota archaeon]|nr:50S ribosomal protein L6 [Candidatus Woesearchaeota archaeon]
MAKEKLEEMLEIPEGIDVKIDGYKITVSKGDKSLSKLFATKVLRFEMRDGKIVFFSDVNTKRQRKILGTYKVLIKNMFKGVAEGHKYILKICSGHFPMTVNVSGNELAIKNFLGESIQRKLRFPPEVSIKVTGDQIFVESIDKSLAGQIAARIETLTKIRGRDIRRFQDGIYIINKDGKELV